MHRTQILLEDEQYELLRTESARTGKSIGELVRTAVENTYSGAERRKRLRQAFRDAAGTADAEDFDGLSGEEYVAKIRRRWTDRVDRMWEER